MGTGTGAIALALKRALPEAEVYATEVDPKALALARENAERLGLSVAFLPAPLTGGLRDLDLVVSNPPTSPRPTGKRPRGSSATKAPWPSTPGRKASRWPAPWRRRPADP